MKKSFEIDIKISVIDKIIESGYLDDSGVLLNEYSLDNNSRRVDLAVLSRDKFYGFEIKSDADSLKRLHGQSIKYLEFFDKLIVVVTSKHLKKSLEILPDNVEVWEFRNNKIIVSRRGRTIKIKNKISFLRLMSMKDLKRFARQENLRADADKRHEIEQHLIRSPLNKIRRKSFLSIFNKYEKATSEFIATAHLLGLQKNNIKALGLRFKERQIEKIEEEEKQFIWGKMKRQTDRDKAMEVMAENYGGNAFGDIPDTIKKILDD